MALSAYVYLATWFLSDYNKLKETKDAIITKNKRVRGGKKERNSDE